MTGQSVARIVTRLNVGGPARHVLILSRSLPDRGYASELIVGSPGPREGELTDPRVPFERLPTMQREVHLRHDAASFRWLLRRLKTGSPSIVHTHMAKAGALGRLAAARAGVPCIVHTFHGHVLEGYFSDTRSALFIRMERWLARRTHALVAVSAAVRDELLELGIGEPEQWRVVPVGLELGDLLRLEGPKERQRPVVGIVGRLTAIKDHDTFLRAMHRVGSLHPDSRFVVAGDGELRNLLERQAESLGDRIRFIGWSSDLPALYSALDIVVLTSRNEGTPVALIEAAAAGLPVVSTNVGGVADVVRDGETGFLTRPGDDAAVARHVAVLLDDFESRRGMGQAGREWVRTRFSADRLVEDISALYSELLHQRALSPRRG